MSSKQTSAAAGFFTQLAPKLQQSDQANPGTEAIKSSIAVFIPDPNSALGGPSIFVTSGGTNWTVTVNRATAGVLGALVETRTVLATNNIIWLALDPALYTLGDVYRVKLTDNAANVMTEFDFEVFAQNIGTGAANISDINNSVRRIAGLLGYRQKITYADYLYGVPRVQTIELQDGAGVALTTYRRKLLLNAAHEVVGETSAALDDLLI